MDMLVAVLLTIAGVLLAGLSIGYLLVGLRTRKTAKELCRLMKEILPGDSWRVETRLPVGIILYLLANEHLSEVERFQIHALVEQVTDMGFSFEVSWVDALPPAQ